jgi:hypothetical protein
MNYTSGKGSSAKKKRRRENRKDKSWRASGQTQEESAILESLKPS